MKFLKRLIVVLVVLGLLGYFVGMPYMREKTKKHSPEETVTYSENNMDLRVTYSRPSKKGRVVFGELVPYDTDWRTGANEPTTFTTASNIQIMGKQLPTGTYSLWTKPGATQWDVIFNKEVPDWGVTILSGGKETTRNAQADAVTVTVPSERMAQVVEKFTIAFEGNEATELVLSWDTTKVRVPLNN